MTKTNDTSSLTPSDIPDAVEQELASVNARLAELQGLVIDMVGILKSLNSAVQTTGKVVNNFSVVLDTFGDPDLMDAEQIAKRIRDELTWRSGSNQV